MLENFQGDSWGSITPLRMPSLLPHDLCHGQSASCWLLAVIEFQLSSYRSSLNVQYALNMQYAGSRQFVVVQSLNLWEPMDCNMPGSSVLHYLLEFAQIHVHWIVDAIQPPHLLPFSSCLQSFPASGSFPLSLLFTSGSASESVLPMNIQGW